ncbi:MAG: flagellar export chaperone FliS [bacterium]
MAQAQHYVTQYREMEIKTADQFELVLLLYRGAAQHLNFAKKYIANKDIEQRVSSINRATAMIGELQAALDFEKGGEIAVSLNKLYSYMMNRLSVANSQQDSTPIDEILKLLSTLQSAWEEARVEYNRMSSGAQLGKHGQQISQAAHLAAS